MFLTFEDTVKLIHKKKLLHIAADESMLEKLPQGNWIGGTTPYFLTENGGEICKNKLSVDVFDFAKNWRTSVYDKSHVLDISTNAYTNGICVIIMPFGSDIASVYAKEQPCSREMLMTPIVGWISGFDLSSGTYAKVYDGVSQTSYTDKAVVLYAELPDDQVASVGFVNIFHPNAESPAVEFDEDTLFVKNARINGRKMNFNDYLLENDVDTKLPLVADNNGMLINASIRSLSAATKTVGFYSPVFANKTYYFAEPVLDYQNAFSENLNIFRNIRPFFSCNCILNYLYGSLEGKATPPFSGPITFGEIAYQLINQTLVYGEII